MKVYKEMKGRYLNLSWISASIAKTKIRSHMGIVGYEWHKRRKYENKSIKNQKTMLETQCVE